MHGHWFILLVLVVAGVVNQALSHESQKNSTGQVQHQVSKTDQGSTLENFSCDHTRGGYYADISSGCQRYHYCTRTEDGSWRHRRMVCPPGTMFDAARNACGWKKVPCDREYHPTVQPEVPEQASPVTGAETTFLHEPKQNATDLRDTVKNNTTERKDGAKRKINKNKKEGRRRPFSLSKICPSNLRYFPDVKSGCRKYYSCFRIGRSTVLKHIFQCPHQKRFDPVKTLCVEASKASPCLFPTRVEYKNATAVVQELFNISSSSTGDLYGFQDLLSSNNTVQALDRAVAGRIMSYVNTGRNLSDAELTSVSTLLSGTQPMPLTVVAAARLLNTGVQRLTNGTYAIERVFSIYADYGDLFASALLDRSRSVVRNLTSLVQRSGAVQALRRSAPFDRFWSAYESFQRNWINMRKRTVRLLDQEGATVPSIEHVNSTSFTPVATDGYSSTLPPPPSEDIVSIEKPDPSIKHKARSHKVPASALKTLSSAEDIHKQSQTLALTPVHLSRKQTTENRDLPWIEDQDRLLTINEMPSAPAGQVAVPDSHYKEHGVFHADPFGGMRPIRRPVLIVDQVDVFHSPAASHFIPEHSSQLVSPVWE